MMIEYNISYKKPWRHFIDFELKNPILNGIMKKSFELGLNKIAKAFEERAVRLYK